MYSRRFSHRAGSRHVQFHRCRMNGNLVDRQLMKHNIHARVGALSSITCDRGGQTWQADTVDAAEFTSIHFAGGYASGWELLRDIQHDPIVPVESANTARAFALRYPAPAMLQQLLSSCA